MLTTLCPLLFLAVYFYFIHLVEALTGFRGCKVINKQDDNDPPHEVIAIMNFSQLKYHKEKHTGTAMLGPVTGPEMVTRRSLYCSSSLSRNAPRKFARGRQKTQNGRF